MWNVSTVGFKLEGIRKVDQVQRSDLGIVAKSDCFGRMIKGDALKWIAVQPPERYLPLAL